MKQFKTILIFELMGYFKNKAFIGTTIFFVLISSLALSLPRIFPDLIPSILGQDIVSEPNIYLQDEDLSQTTDGVYLLNLDFESSENFKEYLKSSLASMSYKAEFTDKSVDEMKEIVKNEEVDKAFYFKSETEYSEIVLDVAMYDFSSDLMQDLLQTYQKTTTLESLGATSEQIENVMSPIIVSEVIQIGKNQIESFIFTYVLIFVLYLAVILYGQFVAMSVVTEKTSRCMELLVTSAKSTSFIFGKVIGSGIAGLLQLSLIFGSVFLSYNINAKLWEQVPFVSTLFNVPVSLLGYMLIFFISGFFIYAFLFGAAASFASKMEDVNSLITPIMLCFIAAFFVTMTSLGSGNFNNPLIVACSYIPLTSSMAMFTRVAMDNVPVYEVVISLAILVATTGFCGWFAAKIYRIGVLSYGNKPNFKTIISALKK